MCRQRPRVTAVLALMYPSRTRAVLSFQNEQRQFIS